MRNLTIKGKKIIILEDQRIIGFELQRQLENNGYTVNYPISLIDAEIFIDKNTCVFIITDPWIQQQNGIEGIKKLIGNRQLPIICIETVTNEETMKQCEGINIIGTFSKPYDSIEIVALIDKFFNLLHNDSN